MLDLLEYMARKKPIHNRHVPHFLSVLLIVTGVLAVLAIAGYAYKMNSDSEVASATTYNGRYAHRVCDVDNNKRITRKDRDTIRDCANRKKSCTSRLKSRSDINKDRRVNVKDINAFNSGCVPAKPTPIPADADVVVDPYDCNFVPELCEVPPTPNIPPPTRPPFVPPAYDEPTPVIHVDPYCAFTTTGCRKCDFEPGGCPDATPRPSRVVPTVVPR